MTPDEILSSENHRSKLVELDVKRYLSDVRYPLHMISENA